MLIRLTANGQPVSAKNGKRAFLTRDGRPFVARSDAIIAWYAKQVPAIRRQFEALDMPTITKFVHIETHQYLRDEVLASSSPDGDNVVSACFDALVKAGVIADDKLCISSAMTRRQERRRPRVEIEIRVLGSLPELP